MVFNNIFSLNVQHKCEAEVETWNNCNFNTNARAILKEVVG